MEMIKICVFTEFTPEQMRNLIAYIFAAKKNGMAVKICSHETDYAIERAKKLIASIVHDENFLSNISFNRQTKKSFWEDCKKGKEHNIFVLDNVINGAMLFWAGAHIKHQVIIDGCLFENGKCVNFFLRDT